MNIGIIRERKTPPDSRVPLTPEQCKHIMQNFPVTIIIESSPNRCFKDAEYEANGVKVVEHLSDCNILLGVKEVPIASLVPEKTYFFFSHTIKKQSYNQKLLQSIIQKSIRMIDYEVLCNPRGQRLIAFGKFAGMVGAHNALWTYGQRTGKFQLPRMKDCYDYKEAVSIYQKTTFPPLRIVLTGSGRVGTGAARVLEDMGIRRVSPKEYLEKVFDEAIFTQLDGEDYAKRKDGSPYVKSDFYKNPEQYISAFASYIEVSDIMVNGIYWDNNAPVFFTLDDMQKPSFNIEVIADVTCDIAPISSIPSTIESSTIADPVFGFDPKTRQKCPPFQANCVDMMTIDNLPNELPRDASTAFGEQFIEYILEELLSTEPSEMLAKATIAADGHLSKHFQYLDDYVNEKE